MLEDQVLQVQQNLKNKKVLNNQALKLYLFTYQFQVVFVKNR